ncbi:hypothetical protein [Rhizobium sp. Leaf341]|uniref:hypothetical protein n=1 Tax=Rhizobium sp. Leaf341 TaxID=1736344 RepID=UPI000713F2BD|nr:hypothetical protein [Rhizobium sp. Leaf341]KQR67891.1 hypothetical protein ASG03_10245 [Rhizobium sp. Leaf341]
MRARRCTSCGLRFYVNPEAPSATCQECDGSYDPSAQAKADADRIAAVNDSRTLGRRKQTLDINVLRNATEAVTAEEAPAVTPRGRGKNAS